MNTPSEFERNAQGLKRTSISEKDTSFGPRDLKKTSVSIMNTSNVSVQNAQGPVRTSISQSVADDTFAQSSFSIKDMEMELVKSIPKPTLRRQPVESDVVFVRKAKKTAPIPIPKPEYVAPKIGDAPKFKPELKIVDAPRATNFQMKPTFIDAQDKMSFRYKVWVQEICQTFTRPEMKLFERILEKDYPQFIEEVNRLKGNAESVEKTTKNKILHSGKIAIKRLQNMNMPHGGVMYNKSVAAAKACEELILAALGRVNSVYIPKKDYVPADFPSLAQTTTPVVKGAWAKPMNSVIITSKDTNEGNEAQMFAWGRPNLGIQDTITETRATMSAVRDALPDLRATLTSAARTSDNLNARIDAISTAFSDFKERFATQHDSIVVEIFSKLSGLILAIYACINAESVQQRVLILASNAFSMNLPGEVMKLVHLLPGLAVPAGPAQDAVVAQALGDWFNLAEVQDLLSKSVCRTLGIKELTIPALFQNASKLSANVRGTNDIFHILYDLSLIHI